MIRLCAAFRNWSLWFFRFAYVSNEDILHIMVSRVNAWIHHRIDSRLLVINRRVQCASRSAQELHESRLTLWLF